MERFIRQLSVCQRGCICGNPTSDAPGQCKSSLYCCVGIIIVKHVFQIYITWHNRLGNVNHVIDGFWRSIFTTFAGTMIVSCRCPKSFVHLQMSVILCSKHQWSYMSLLASIGFCCMYRYICWYVLWNILVCIDMLCIMACIGMYYFWYVLHVSVCIGMYSRVMCASIQMYWLVLACMEKWYVLYILVCICMYWYQLIYIDLYLMHWYGLVCMVCTSLNL